MESDSPVTLKHFLLNVKGVSKRTLSKLKRTPMGITCNGQHIRVVDMVQNGDTITLSMPDEHFLDPNPALNAPVVYESNSVVVFDKPDNMPVHPSVKHQGDTLGNRFAYLYPELTFRPVNRLDRDTSGLCAVAKNPYSVSTLNISKIYYAIVCGKINGSGTIDAPIAREHDSIIKRCVRNDGQHAVTHYKAISGNSKYTLLEISLETGRTHQIRVHLSYIGFPLAGDELYGGDTSDISGQALHCGKLSFFDVSKEENIEITSSIRHNMSNLLLK